MAKKKKKTAQAVREVPVLSSAFHPKCAGCLRAAWRANKCMTFIEPHYQWRKRKSCFGRIDDPAVLSRIEEETAAYIRIKRIE